MKHWKLYIGMIILLACSKQTIELDLTDHENPNLVIEGRISDSLETQTIRCALTSNFGDTVETPVTDAFVTVYTDEGVYDFAHTSGGIYNSVVPFNGIPGQTYKIETIHDGELYDVLTKMPDPIVVDSVMVDTIILNVFSKIVDITLRLDSEADQFIYYKMWRKDSTFFGGWQEIPIPIYWVAPVIAAANQDVRLPADDQFFDIQFSTGNEIRIEVFAISKDVGEYLLKLNDYINKELPNSQFHNPPFYFTNDAYGLGYGAIMDDIVYTFE